MQVFYTLYLRMQTTLLTENIAQNEWYPLTAQKMETRVFLPAE